MNMCYRSSESSVKRGLERGSGVSEGSSTSSTDLQCRRQATCGQVHLVQGSMYTLTLSTSYLCIMYYYRYHIPILTILSV